MPKHPNWKSFVRASTLSLGSIAFGSLIVTILEIIRMLMNIVQQNAAQDGNAIGAILACVASCCIGCIESLVAWFNRYAYIEISLYGKAYVSSLSSGSSRSVRDRDAELAFVISPSSDSCCQGHLAVAEGPRNRRPCVFSPFLQTGCYRVKADLFSSQKSSTTRSSALPSLSERTSSLSAAPCTFDPSDEGRWA